MSGLRGVGNTRPAGERGLVLQPARRPGAGGGGDGRAGFGKMEGWTDGPADGVSDAHGGRGGRVRGNTSGLKDGWGSRQMAGGGRRDGRADGNTVGCDGEMARGTAGQMDEETGMPKSARREGQTDTSQEPLTWA